MNIIPPTEPWLWLIMNNVTILEFFPVRTMHHLHGGGGGGLDFARGRIRVIYSIRSMCETNQRCFIYQSYNWTKTIVLSRRSVIAGDRPSWRWERAWKCLRMASREFDSVISRETKRFRRTRSGSRDFSKISAQLRIFDSRNRCNRRSDRLVKCRVLPFVKGFLVLRQVGMSGRI